MSARDLSDAEIVAELERRRLPVTAQCPNCTRRDAIICLQCADCGLAHFPLRPRMLYRLKAALERVRREAQSLGIPEQEIEDYQL